MATKIDNYWNRFDEGKGYVELLYRDGYGAQGSEQNEMQSIINARIAKLARALFKDGDIINGAQIVVNPENGHVTATSGEVCLAGQIWSVPRRGQPWRGRARRMAAQDRGRVGLRDGRRRGHVLPRVHGG